MAIQKQSAKMSDQTFVLLTGITITLFLAFAISVFMSLFTLSYILYVIAISFLGFVLILTISEMIESGQTSNKR
ncbi:MAG: hypothetical protein QW582_01670 [Candidatus Micrarchaeaceae archaeon]